MHGTYMQEKKTLKFCFEGKIAKILVFLISFTVIQTANIFLLTAIRKNKMSGLLTGLPLFFAIEEGGL